MNEDEKQRIISELRQIYKKLKSYKRYLQSEKLSESQKRYMESLREDLVRKSAVHKEIISKLSNYEPFYQQFGQIRGIWSDALNPSGYLPSKLTGLGFCIDSTNEAIASLEAQDKNIKTDLITKPGKTKEQPQKADIPIQTFDAMQFHQKIIKASRDLFKDGHYAQAIFEAFKAVEIFVKEKSGCDAYGRNLMATAFNEEKPKIVVPEGGVFNKDVQEGFKLLFMGASQGIRDTKAHNLIIQKDPYITLEYLGFASFLLKRIDYWEAGIT